ncbi:hypothetical protein B0J13DRAFT_522216 [Dactylonectria estremocensis]|uniref:Uncharacterized protein n=1 Tax=Dactylonectria estremocensis TaxID=1079267 RepID=A0A9P9J5I8_9HYPO|nr:hypothetical protein B0J13DRAFT_522216 [Dactylonectria estremocensis]
MGNIPGADVGQNRPEWAPFGSGRRHLRQRGPEETKMVWQIDQMLYDIELGLMSNTAARRYQGAATKSYKRLHPLPDRSSRTDTGSPAAVIRSPPWRLAPAEAWSWPNPAAPTTDALSVLQLHTYGKLSSAGIERRWRLTTGRLVTPSSSGSNSLRNFEETPVPARRRYPDALPFMALRITVSLTMFYLPFVDATCHVIPVQTAPCWNQCRS